MFDCSMVLCEYDVSRLKMMKMRIRWEIVPLFYRLVFSYSALMLVINVMPTSKWNLGNWERARAFDGHTISDFYLPVSAKPNTCPQITSFSPFND